MPLAALRQEAINAPLARPAVCAEPRVLPVQRAPKAPVAALSGPVIKDRLELTNPLKRPVMASRSVIMARPRRPDPAPSKVVPVSPPPPVTTVGVARPAPPPDGVIILLRPPRVDLVAVVVVIDIIKSKGRRAAEARKEGEKAETAPVRAAKAVPGVAIPGPDPLIAPPNQRNGLGRPRAVGIIKDLMGPTKGAGPPGVIEARVRPAKPAA